MKIGFEANLDGQTIAGFFAEQLTQPLQTVSVLEGKALLCLETKYDRATGISARRLTVENQTDKAVTLYYAHIRYELEVPHAALDYFASDWGMEYTPVRTAVTYPVRFGTWSGRSSKGCSPYFQVGAVSGQGPLLGISVEWSGNWEATVCRCEPVNLVTVGLNKDDFYTVLQPGRKFENIEIFDGLCQAGNTEELAGAFRTYYRDEISLMPGRFDSLPVCYNSWWPYEDKWINEEVFLRDAAVARELGFTNTLLDAGWFGPPLDPTQPDASPWFRKQGDWDQINTNLFPAGLEALGANCQKIAGLPFGIWCEIEAVGKDSCLFERHPELIARKDGEFLNYVCMGNPKTREWALEVFRRLVEEYGAKWIKIDFNLDPVSCDCEEHGHGAGDGLYYHYLGLYEFMDEVRRRYPDLVLENCSSGGLRIDYGIMQHCHLAFLSDPDYTPHHLKCFWGMLSHIHPCGCYHFTKSDTVCDHNYAWDEQGIRYAEANPVTEATSLARFDYMTRAAMMSSVGFSLKLGELPDWALQRIRQHVELFHRIAGDYLLRGDCYRLTGQPREAPGLGPAWSAFQFTAPDGDSLLFAFKKRGGNPELCLKLKGLAPEGLFTISDAYTEQVVCSETGFRLMETGVRLTAAEDEWSAVYRIARN